MNNPSAPNKTPGARVLDVNTKTIMKRFGVDGPICVLTAGDNALDEKIVEGMRRTYAEILDDSELLCITDDMSDDSFTEKRSILGGRFGLILCGHVFEHIEKPWEVAPKIEWLLRPGGHLRYTGGWAWGYHPYPDDYWRMSISGLRVLFPNVEWLDWWYLGTNKGIGVQIDVVAHERKYFQQTDAEMKPFAEKITNRSIAYLKIEAIGKKK